jgi:hypothetical protein
VLPQPHPAVVAQEVDGRLVLLHTERESYFGLNGVGARIWGLLPPRNLYLSDLCRSLEAEYPEVGSDRIRGDVEELIDQLLREDLLRDAA